MSAKVTIFVFFAQALLIQTALSQVCGHSAFAAFPSFGSYGLAGSAVTSPVGYNDLASGLSGNDLVCNGLAGNSLAYDNIYTPAIEITPTTGGGLPVTCASAIASNSLVVASENMYEGTLALGGEMPFLGTAGLEGVLPTAGSGAVNHACGNGATRIVSQDGAAVASGFGTGFAPAAAFAPENLYGTDIGAYGIAAVAAPFGYTAGLTALASPAAGLAGPYPGASFTCAYPTAGYGAEFASYGGAGEGNVVIAGELPVTGTSTVTCLVPIMGAVSLGGDVPAAGAVTISGKCACGCGNPYVY